MPAFLQKGYKQVLCPCMVLKTYPSVIACSMDLHGAPELTSVWDSSHDYNTCKQLELCCAPPWGPSLLQNRAAFRCKAEGSQGSHNLWVAWKLQRLRSLMMLQPKPDPLATPARSELCAARSCR